jgi:hypothetical protein
MYHGHGAGSDNRDDKLAQFCHLVDEEVRRRIDDPLAPLVLAGVDSLTAVQATVCRHQNLIEDTITGNPEHFTAEQLRDKAWRLVEPHFTRALDRAVRRYRELSARNLTSTDLEEATFAAREGRVEVLFVDSKAHRWGQVDARNRQVQTHGELRAGDDDLLDLAAREVFLHGGSVHALPPAAMPTASPIAAIFRYGMREPTALG